MTNTAQPIRGCPSTTGNECQLNTTTLIRHAARTHGDQEIVYRTPDGGWDRYTYADCYARVCRSANALRALGVEPGDRVGILDWNSRRHFELYWSIPGLGAVMLQMNLRLGAEDLGYVVGHSKVSTKTCWPPPTPRSTGPRSTKPRLTAPATPPAPRANPRACTTRTAASTCTPRAWPPTWA